MLHARFCGVLAICALLCAGQVIAASWPQIPPEEKAFTEVEGYPNAPAVILLRQGRVHFDKDSRSSYAEIYTRIKILNEEGVDYGSISLPSTDFMRTKEIEGRTHAPDGRIVELSKDAKFEKEYSDYYGLSVVSCALPVVVPGAIIEYRYRTYFDSIFYPRIWYFQTELPTLVSQVTYELPNFITYAPVVYRTLADMVIDEKVERNVTGASATYTGRDLSPVPDEPSRYPFSDLASRVMFIPVSRQDRGGMAVPLFNSWQNTVEMAWGSSRWGYRCFRENAAKARKQGKTLAAAHKLPRDKAEAIYRWVRDEIETERFSSIWSYDGEADVVLKERKADRAEKALLLQIMLKGAKIDSRLGWTQGRSRGRINPEVIFTHQFNRILVVLDLGGERFFLDPSDRSLRFGALQPSLQAVPCLLITKKSQEWTTTPQIPAQDSQHAVRLELAVDSEGGVAGDGSMKLTGNHAWRRTLWTENADEAANAWTDWIEDRFEGYDVTKVQVDEKIETAEVDVAWHLSLRAEEVLGDEVAISVAAPLAVTANPFVLTPAKRRTPVLLSFPDVESVHLELSWSEGWILEGEPRLSNLKCSAGTLATSLEADENLRTLVLHRSLTVSKKEFVGNSAYGSLRRLYVRTVKNDGEELVLVSP